VSWEWALRPCTAAYYLIALDSGQVDAPASLQLTNFLTPLEDKGFADRPSLSAFSWNGPAPQDPAGPFPFQAKKPALGLGLTMLTGTLGRPGELVSGQQPFGHRNLNPWRR
jgi:hypothetical protein